LVGLDHLEQILQQSLVVSVAQTDSLVLFLELVMVGRKIVAVLAVQGLRLALLPLLHLLFLCLLKERPFILKMLHDKFSHFINELFLDRVYTCLDIAVETIKIPHFHAFLVFLVLLIIRHIENLILVVINFLCSLLSRRAQFPFPIYSICRCNAPVIYSFSGPIETQLLYFFIFYECLLNFVICELLKLRVILNMIKLKLRIEICFVFFLYRF
jgi:hypothetical protein